LVNRNAAQGGSRSTDESLIHTRPDIDSPYVAPSNSVEQTIADIWRGLLGLDRVGVNDDFFNLGGHSLLAIELVSKLRDAFQVELPVGRFFQSPTVAGLAQAVGDFQVGQRNPKKDDLLDILSQFSDQEVESGIEKRTVG
jgi:acyl carrier protein